MADFTPKKKKRIIGFAKWQDTKVLVHANEFKDGNAFIDFRQFQEDDTGEYAPTSKGLSIHVKNILDMKKAVNKAIAYLDERGIAYGDDFKEPTAKKRKKK